VALPTIAVVLLVAWLVGFGLYELMGAAIRLLIAMALVALIFRIIGARPFRGRSAVPPAAAGAPGGPPDRSAA
jgi:Family of unknown function (DUF5670)